MRFLILAILMCSCALVSCSLFYPSNSAYGILAAIAVPLDLPHRNVFISYNFEANYNLPPKWQLPPHFENLADEDFYEARRLPTQQCGNCTSTVSPIDGLDVEGSGDVDDVNDIDNKIDNEKRTRRSQRRESRSLLSRTNFYYILQDKFEKSGFPGKACLLRLICETNASELGQVNGVLGSVMHVLFSPSTSMREDLPLEYYQAKTDGVHDLCEQHYHDECPEGILDLISIPLHEIINSLEYNSLRI